MATQEIHNAECEVAAAKLVIAQGERDLAVAKKKLSDLKRMTTTTETVQDTRTLLNG